MVRRTAIVLAVPAACAGLIGIAQFVAPSTSSTRATTQLVDTGGLPTESPSPTDEAGDATITPAAASGSTGPGDASLAGTLVRGKYLLRGPASVPAGGSVLYVLQGPKRVVKVARSAPFTVRIDTRALPDGTYQLVVSTVVGGKRTVARTAKIIIANKGGAPSQAAPKPTSSVTPTGAPAAPATTPTKRRPAPTTSRPASQTRKPAPTTQAPQNPSFAAQVVALTNQQRAAGGCQPLTADATLAAVALAHSQDMAARNFFDHNSQDGRTPFDRMTAAGYQFRTAAENIAAGQRTPQDVVTAWMNSAGHKANIMNCSLTEIGVGYATGGRFGTYWTQDFGTPR